MRQQVGYLGLVLIFVTCLISASADSAGPDKSATLAAAKESHDGSHDFDFLFGSWRIHNRRLSPESHAWETFEATHTTVPLLGGLANEDEFVPQNWHPGFIGLSLRLFDPAKKVWSIYWIDNRTVTMDSTPVVGRFDHGVGVFVADDLAEGKPIKTRYKWSDITPTSARWELATSADAGRTWDTTWTTDFTRVAPYVKN